LCLFFSREKLSDTQAFEVMPTLVDPLFYLHLVHRSWLLRFCGYLVGPSCQHPSLLIKMCYFHWMGVFSDRCHSQYVQYVHLISFSSLLLLGSYDHIISKLLVVTFLGALGDCFWSTTPICMPLCHSITWCSFQIC
jgi:hypothetical protein